MTVSVADIDEWSVESIREVHRAAAVRARASRDAAQGLNALAIFETWEGETADAAREAIASTGKDLDMDAGGDGSTHRPVVRYAGGRRTELARNGGRADRSSPGGVSTAHNRSELRRLGRARALDTKNGRWYQANWVDYQFEAEHLTNLATEQDLAGLSLPVVGLGEWEPITIQEIHNAAAHNPRLTMYIPDICGPTIAIGADESSITPGLPTASVPK